MELNHLVKSKSLPKVTSMSPHSKLLRFHGEIHSKKHPQPQPNKGVLEPFHLGAWVASRFLRSVGSVSGDTVESIQSLPGISGVANLSGKHKRKKVSTRFFRFVTFLGVLKSDLFRGDFCDLQLGNQKVTWKKLEDFSFHVFFPNPQ